MSSARERFGRALSDSLPAWGELLRIRPNDRDQYAATRVALSVFVPVLGVWAIGRDDLLLFAVFAAFTGVFGRNHAHRQRLRLQLLAGVAQVLSLVIGSVIGLVADGGVLFVFAAAGWAAIWTVVGGRVRWVPPGPMFPVFALGATATTVTDAGTLAAGTVVGIVTAAWCILVGSAEGLLWLPRRRRAHNPFRERVQGPPPPHGLAGSAALFGVVTLLAGVVPLLLDEGHAYWGMVTAIAVLTPPTVRARATRAVQRLAGTVIGLGLGWIILSLHPSALVSLLVVAVLQFVIELFVMRNYAIASIFIAPLVLVMSGMVGSASVAELISDRWLQTLIGCVIGFVAALVMAFAASRRPTLS